MRVCFLVHELRRSGGVQVVLSHARGLMAAGHEVHLVLTGRQQDSDAEGPPAMQLREARDLEYDWAISTWWETAPCLYEVRARRRLAFLQSFEQRFYTEDEPLERQGAASVLGLPVDYLVVSDWMQAVLAQLRPDVRCRVVRNGIDKALFSSRRRAPREGPLRVLVEGQPTLWFKGVRDAVDAVRAMRSPVELTLAALDPPEPGDLDVDRVVGGLSGAEMADLYADSDVLLKLSRVEGLGLPPLEAFHAGVPCVATPFGPHADFLEHWRNGLVVGYDDIGGTARALDLLADDRGLLEELSSGALATARAWPGVDEAGEAFAATLQELDASEAPDPASGMGDLLAGLRLTQETARRATGDALDRLARSEQALAGAQALVHELSSSRDECAELLDQAHAELERIRSTLPYRAAARARSAIARARR